jgi:phosphonate transport system substrate-binding protein
VLSYTTYDKMVKKGEIDPAVCRIVWTTPTYEDYNFTSHPRLEEMFGAGFTQKLQTALIDMKDKALLDAFPRSAIVKASNADYDKIKETATELGLVR